jgi:alpha-N-arabinofuranosidase
MPLTVIEQLVLQDRKDEHTTEPNHPSSLKHTPLTINPHNLVHPNEPPISDKLYGGFIEHVGRCIYGGIVDDPKHPSSKELLEPQDKGTPGTKGRLGWRKDVMKVIGQKGELEIPMLRWPGGTSSSEHPALSY